MVFSQLSSQEKDAFFGLLDEFRIPYFASRPDLLSNIAKSQAVNSAANSVQDALKNPTTRNAAIDTIKSGLNSPRASWNAKREPASDQTDETVNSGPGRVAAAAASLMSHPRFGGPPTSTSTGGPPKPPPRKVPANSTADDSNSPPPLANKPPLSSLTSTRTFGSDVDLTSAKGFFTSVRNSSSAKSSTQPLVSPSSFLPPSSSGTGARKKQFAPPPVRRVTSDSSPTSTTPPVAPSPPPRRKEEPVGEPAEVLYDYTGEEPGDLDIKCSQQVVIVERNTEEWWTAELNGKRGLVPASYVKVL